MDVIPEAHPRELLEEFRVHVEQDYPTDGVPVRVELWERRCKELRWRWVESVRQRPVLRAEFLRLATLHVREEATALFSELERQGMGACDALASALKAGNVQLEETRREWGGGWVGEKGVELTGIAARNRELEEHRKFLWGHCTLWRDRCGMVMFERVRKVLEAADWQLRTLWEFGVMLGRKEDAAFTEAIAGARRALVGIDALLLQGREADLWEAAHYYLCAYHGYAPEERKDETVATLQSFLLDFRLAIGDDARGESSSGGTSPCRSLVSTSPT